MAIDRTGISSLDTGASDITYTGDQGPKSPDQMLMASADPMLVEEYDKYVFEMEEQGLQPISFKEFVQQIMSGMADGGIARLGYKDGYSVQGGVKNYLGNQETVNNVPVKWQSGPDKPETELAYITKAEKDLILKKDLHGSLQDGPNMGPGGLMSLDSAGSGYGGPGPGSSSGGQGGGQGGGGPHYDPVAAAQAQAAAVEAENRRIEDSKRIANEIAAAKLENMAKNYAEDYQDRKVSDAIVSGRGIGDYPTGIHDVTGMPQQPPGGGDPDMYWIGDTGGANITVPGDEQYQTISPKPIGDYEDDKILRIAAGEEPGYRPQDERPFGLSKEEAFRQGKITEDQYKYSDPVLTLDRGLDTGTTGLGGGAGGAGTNVPGTPIVPEGITAAESAQSFEDAKAAEIAKVQAAAAGGAPFKDYYVGGDPTTEQEKFMQEAGAAASMVGREAWPAAYGGRVPAAFGGIMDSATGRKAYGLGSIGKALGKAAKAVGKVLKSPVGMMALTGLLGGQAGLFGQGASWKKFLPALIGEKPIPGFPAGREEGTLGWLGKLGLTKGKGSMMPTAFGGILGLSAAPFLFQGKEEGTDFANMDYGKGLDLLDIRKRVQDKKATREEFPYLNPDQYAAQGGRIGYQDGRSVRSVALNQLYGIMPKRKMAQEGGLMDLGGMEKDYREEGGFVPIGGQERADDVPARLSKNEFVFTADAVRAAGGGDIDKGAEVMENVMENLEQGGQVSQESQGLEGARNMFATAQRLEGVL